MNPYFEAVKNNNHRNGNGGIALLFETKVVYDSGEIYIITTFTPDPAEPNKNYQITRTINLPFTENISEIIGKQHDLIIQRLNNQPNRTV